MQAQEQQSGKAEDEPSSLVDVELFASDGPPVQLCCADPYRDEGEEHWQLETEDVPLKVAHVLSAQSDSGHIRLCKETQKTHDLPPEQPALLEAAREEGVIWMRFCGHCESVSKSERVSDSAPRERRVTDLAI